MTIAQVLNLTLWFYLLPMLFNYIVAWVWDNDLIKGSYASAMWKQRDPNAKRASLLVRYLPPVVWMVSLIVLFLILLDIVIFLIEAIRPKD